MKSLLIVLSFLGVITSGHAAFCDDGVKDGNARLIYYHPGLSTLTVTDSLAKSIYDRLSSPETCMAVGICGKEPRTAESMKPNNGLGCTRTKAGSKFNPGPDDKFECVLDFDSQTGASH